MTVINVLAVLLIVLILVSGLNFIIVKNRRAQTLNQLQGYADNQITNRINKHIFFTSIWKAMVVQNDGKVVEFQDTSQRIVRDYGQEEIKGVMLAPAGKVEYVYGQDLRMRIGTDLLTTEFSKTNAVRAKYTGLTTLSEFYKEMDGSYSLYIYNPIYLHQSGEKQFWGFSILALKVPDLFNGIGFTELGDHINFTLSGAVDGIKGETTYLRSTHKKLVYPVNYYFSVPNGTWHFAASWSGGWVTAGEIAWEFAVIVIILILTVIFTFLNRKEAELTDISRSDPLTGMYNRRALRATFSGIAKESGELSAIFIDIDDFKHVNDEEGHEQGDMVLKILAGRLIAAFGQKHCFRYGGDEFLVITPGSDLMTIERQLNVVNVPIRLTRDDGSTRIIHISGGHARASVRNNEDLRKLIRKADAKLYEAKTKGKNQILE